MLLHIIAQSIFAKFGGAWSYHPHGDPWHGYFGAWLQIFNTHRVAIFLGYFTALLLG